MRINSPVSALSEIITNVRTASDNYRDTLRKNEAATRIALIDPILRGLGWDLSNTFMVEVEKTQGNTVRADYVLKDSNGKVVHIIEAKKLGTNLPINSHAATQYGDAFDTSSVFLSDGLCWEHYIRAEKDKFAHAKTLVPPSNSSSEIAAYLIGRLDATQFWPEESEDEATLQLQSELAELRRQVEVLTARITPTPTANPQATAPQQLTVSPATDYGPLNLVGNVNGMRVKSLRLPDGTTIPINSWKSVLVNCCYYVLARKHDINIPLRDRLGRNVVLLNDIQPPASMRAVPIQYNDRIVYLYTIYDATNCVLNAQYLIDQLPPKKKPVEAAIIFG